MRVNVWPLVRLVARRFGIGEDVLAYLKAHLAYPQPAEVTIPRELIPIGARLYARGLMNHLFFPTNLDWVLPYWAVRQFDPLDPGYLARGFHLYHLNAHYRDWTAIGIPGHPAEAVVDPRGLLTSGYDGWSLDVWLWDGERLVAPSRLPAVDQHLRRNLPCVVTRWHAGGVEVTLQAWADAFGKPDWVRQEVTVRNVDEEEREAVLLVAIRPYNPEGVSLVHHVRWDRDRVWVNNCLGLLLSQVPDAVGTSELARGDVAFQVPHLNGKTEVTCPRGLATAAGLYRFYLDPGEDRTLTLSLPLGRCIPPTGAFADPGAADMGQFDEAWDQALSGLMSVEVPDPEVQAAFEANRAYMLLFWDGDSITPGPLTYHAFWFRDAAYQVWALDHLGAHYQAEQVLRSYPRYQQLDGFFRSQGGEWDSAGQAVWTLIQHARLTGDPALLEELWGNVRRALDWVEGKRQGTPNRLLPPGPSAEHFGPSDQYYWDDLWAVAAMRDAAQAARWLGREEEAKALWARYEAFWADLEWQWNQDHERLGVEAIPASPNRRVDAGAIGVLAALYPLRLVLPDDPRLLGTLRLLEEQCFAEGVFVQQTDHAAFGTYLNMHVAQCHLLRRSHRAWDIIRWLLRHASATWTWAEGINPRTRAGGMGDGHHGWAAADWIHLVRHLLLVEEEDDDRLLLVPILSEAWTAAGNRVALRRAPTAYGPVSFTLTFDEGGGELTLEADWRRPPAGIELALPRAVTRLEGQAVQRDARHLIVDAGAWRVAWRWATDGEP